jgi:hypothetical protein
MGVAGTSSGRSDVATDIADTLKFYDDGMKEIWNM